MSGEKYHVVGDMLCEWVGHCTCGVPPHGHYGAHEPGCGLEMIAPVEQLIAPITAEDVHVAERAWLENGHPDAPFMHRFGYMADHLNRRTTAPSAPTPVAGTSDAGNEKEKKL